jgi:hypothetical protein
MFVNAKRHPATRLTAGDGPAAVVHRRRATPIAVITQIVPALLRTRRFLLHGRRLADARC